MTTQSQKRYVCVPSPVKADDGDGAPRRNTRHLVVCQDHRFQSRYNALQRSRDFARCGQGFHSFRSDINAFSQAPCRRAIVMTQVMGPAQTQQDSDVGGVQSGRALLGYDGVLIRLALPSFRCFVEHPGKRPFGNQALSYHRARGLTSHMKHHKGTGESRMAYRGWSKSRPASLRSAYAYPKSFTNRSSVPRPGSNQRA